MAQEIITLEDLQAFRLQLLNDLKDFLNKQNQPREEWLRSKDVRKMLNISHGTLQNLRVNGTLPYRKIGGIIYYNLRDINDVLRGQASR